MKFTYLRSKIQKGSFPCSWLSNEERKLTRIWRFPPGFVGWTPAIWDFDRLNWGFTNSDSRVVLRDDKERDEGFGGSRPCWLGVLEEEQNRKIINMREDWENGNDIREIWENSFGKEWEWKWEVFYRQKKELKKLCEFLKV